MRPLAAILLAGCVPSKQLSLDLSADVASILIELAGGQHLAFDRSTYDDEGLAFSLGEEDALLRLYPHTLEELLLHEGAVQFDFDGQPLPQPSAAYRISGGDEREIDPVDELPRDDLRISLDRWYGCLAEQRCVRELPAQPNHYLCAECAVSDPIPPEPADDPLPPAHPLAAGCLGAVVRAGPIDVCALPATSTCAPGTADFLDGDPACTPIGRPCFDPWPQLPPDTIFVGAGTTIDQALAALDGDHPSRTIALPEGTHLALSPIEGVSVIGRCMEAVLATSGMLEQARFENLTLDAVLPPDSSFSLHDGVLRSFAATTASVSIQRSLILDALDLSSSLTVVDSVIDPPGEPWAIRFDGGDLFVRGVRIDSSRAALIGDAIARMERVASRGRIQSTTTTLSLEQIALGPIEGSRGLAALNSVVTATNVLVEGGSPFSVSLEYSSGEFDGLVIRSRDPSAIPLITGASTLRARGVLIDGPLDDAISIGFASTATVTDVYVTLGEPAPMMTEAVAVAVDPFSRLVLRRAVIRGTTNSDRCLSVGGAHVSISDLDCRSAGRNIGLFVGDATVLRMERVYLEGFQNAIWSHGADIEAKNLTVVGYENGDGDLAGQLHFILGRFVGDRIEIHNAPENALTAELFDQDRFHLSNATMTDCYSGLLIRRGFAAVEKIAIIGAERRGLTIDGSIEIGFAAGRLQDVAIVAANPEAFAAIEAVQFDQLQLDRFSIEGGQVGLFLGTIAPLMSSGNIARTPLGIGVVTPLDRDPLQLLRELRFEEVIRPFSGQDR